MLLLSDSVPSMAEQPHVTLSGAISGDYVVEDQRPDGHLLLAPDMDITDESESTVDERSDLDTFSADVASETMRRLDKEERDAGLEAWKA
jgi:hypothetical protein